MVLGIEPESDTYKAIGSETPDYLSSSREVFLSCITLQPNGLESETMLDLRVRVRQGVLETT